MSLRLILIHLIYRVVFGVGIAALMWVGGNFVFAKTYQWYAMSRFRNHPSSPGKSDLQLPSRAPLRRLRLRPGLEIPDRDPLSDMVLTSPAEDFRKSDAVQFDETLPGRLVEVEPTTSLRLLRLDDEKVAGAPHRSALVPELRSLHVGDIIQLSTPGGSFGYFVTTIEVTPPPEAPTLKSPGHSQIRIIMTSSSPSVGAVPQQFVVHAMPQDPVNN